MVKKHSLIWFTILVGLVNGFGAERIYMPYFELINVHSDYQYSTAKLFKNYVEDGGKYQIVLPEKLDSTQTHLSEDSVRAIASSLNCPFFLMGDMNRIGETVILNVALYESKSGNRLWGDRLKAANPEDLDPIFQRLAKSVGSENKASAQGDIYSVTDYENRELKKIQVNNSFGIGLGGIVFTPGMIFGKSWDEPFVGGFGVFWAYDSRNILFQVDGETYPTSDVSEFAAVSISAFKPFQVSNLTAFGGGGLGIGMASNVYQEEITEGNGLMVQGGGGILFNRNSNVQLRLEAKYVLGLFEMSSPRKEFPRAVIVKMELAFGR